MNLRMTLATAVATLALAGLAGCDSGSTATTEPTPSPSESTATASPEPVDPAAALVGDWHAPKSEWVVHFNEDGTYTEDFQGIVNFRIGTYTVDLDEVSLIGDDGNTDRGKKVGESIEYPLGILTRM